MIDRKTMLLGCAATALVRKSLNAEERVISKNEALQAALRRPNSLAGVAARAGLLFGTCGKSRDLIHGSGTYDEAYRDLVLRECSLLVPESGASPDSTRKSKDGFDFSLVEPLAKFAAEHGLAFGADHLVWHNAIPTWVKETITDRDAALQEMLLEVTTTATHFAGHVYYWVVANEVVYPYGGEPSGLRRSFWYDKIGPDYIRHAFVAAREADPEAMLILNDYGLESVGDEKKRQAMLTLLRTLVNNDTPIDGLGMESHLREDRRIDPDVLGRFLDEVTGLGLKIFVTELDVQDTKSPADGEAQDAAVAQLTGQYLDVVTRHPGLQSITTWGLSDNHSWYNAANTSADLLRKDGLPARGTLFDQRLRPKAAYNAVISALGAAAGSKGA